MNAVFYLLDALRLFPSKSPEEVREMAFEIACYGSAGLTFPLTRRRMSCKRCQRGWEGKIEICDLIGCTHLFFLELFKSPAKIVFPIYAPVG